MASDSVRIAPSTSGNEFRERLVGFAAGFAGGEQYRQHHVARLGETPGELPVDIERALGLLERRSDLKQLGRYAAGRRARIGVRRHEAAVGPEKPVFFPEARFGHRLPLPLVLIVV